MFPDYCRDHECPPPGQSPPVCDLRHCQAQVKVQNPYQQALKTNKALKIRGLVEWLTLKSHS